MSVSILSSFLLIHFSFSVNRVGSSENLELLLDKWFLKCGGGVGGKEKDIKLSQGMFPRRRRYLCINVSACVQREEGAL